MTNVMEHSGVFRIERRGIFDRYRSTDFRHDLPQEDKSPLRETNNQWRLDDGKLIELKVEYFYFPFETYENYRRYTLTIDGNIVAINRVENHYAFDGTVGPEKVIMQTDEGELVTNHVRILDEEGLGTHEFEDSASWCKRELTHTA